MSEKRNLKKIYQSEQHDPINFTCGRCRYVHKFEKENPYFCPILDVVEPEIPGVEN